MLSNPKLAFLSASILPLISVHAQSTNSNCLSLKGSTACPSFQDAYINPTNLSSAWPWMSNVKDVASFDTQANLYFSDPTRFHATKFNDQLQCNRTAAQNTTLQWQKTILCGQWSQISYSAQCNVENRADPIMVCQDTCVAYSNTQKSIVQNPQICEADDSLSSYQSTRRNDTLTKDFVDCTNWTSLVSTNNATCVEGIENEGNCGFGSELSDQLCAYCDPTGNNAIDSCCYDQKTDLSGCRTFGHPNAALVKATMSIPPQIGASSTSPATSQTGLADNSNTNNNDDDGDAGLSKGQLAGAIVGSILGALLLGALLTFFLFKRRNNNRTDQENVGSNGGVYSNIAPVAAVSNEKGWNHSNQSHGGINSPQMAEKSVSPEVIGGGGAGLIGAGAIAASKGNEASSPQSRPISSLSASSGTDGRGTTVPLVRDQYSGHDILPGESVIAIYPYNASLNDELTLELEDRINVARLYDDGWALGTNASSGEQGAFPLVCVTSEKGDAPMSRANGTGTSVTGTSGTDDGLTSGNEAFTSDAEAVTADEGYVSASSRR